MGRKVIALNGKCIPYTIHAIWLRQKAKFTCSYCSDLFYPYYLPLFGSYRTVRYLSGTVPVIEADSDRRAAVDVGAEWRGKLTAPTAPCIFVTTG